ncbi:MAG: GNAT family N-acetyltransferase [Halieaceae bacterium]|jgi:GNAT superfamily N-acetyltransferase|nr:GNAT family N-acetyltransferase [Halieaceae bacterium]
MRRTTTASAAVAELTIWYLEMTAAAQHCPAPLAPGFDVVEASVPQYPVNRFLYHWIGEAWHWTDKRDWSGEQWRAYVERDGLRTWLAFVAGSPAGYFELERQRSGSVEIAYFGLAPTFIGRGFGSGFLSRAIAEAWAWDASRVTVNTCSLDHPRALENYRRRGFRLSHSEIHAR